MNKSSKRLWYTVKSKPGKCWLALQRTKPEIQSMKDSFDIVGPFETRDACREVSRIGELKC